MVVRSIGKSKGLAQLRKPLGACEAALPLSPSTAEQALGGKKTKWGKQETNSCCGA